MAISDNDIKRADEAGRKRLAISPRAIAARYDRRRARIVVSLENGVELTFPPHLAEGLEDAVPSDLAAIEISPSGLGLRWPRLDADFYLPALLQGIFGSPRWTAEMLGHRGGRVRTKAKAAAARANGRRGGRPRNTRRG